MRWNFGRGRPLGIWAGIGLALVSAQSQAAMARTLQCVPYARQVSGIAIHGNANTWWNKAEGRYARGAEPKVGAVLAFRPSPAMPLGHVAVVSEIVDDRHIMLDHANWSRPGGIERKALAVDVSDEGDWSAVRVWYARTNSLGARTNPTYGFIYGEWPDRGQGQLALNEVAPEPDGKTEVPPAGEPG